MSEEINPNILMDELTTTRNTIRSLQEEEKVLRLRRNDLEIHMYALCTTFENYLLNGKLGGMENLLNMLTKLHNQEGCNE